MSNFKTDVKGSVVLIYKADNLKTPIATVNSADDVEDMRGQVLEAVQSAYNAGINSVYEMPIWAASKFPVSRPVAGARVLAWNEHGEFIGNGIAIETRESGIAIRFQEGTVFDSNNVIHWVYSLQSDKHQGGKK